LCTLLYIQINIISKSIQCRNSDVSKPEEFTWKFFEYLKDWEHSSSQTAVSEYAELCSVGIKLTMGPSWHQLRYLKFNFSAPYLIFFSKCMFFQSKHKFTIQHNSSCFSYSPVGITRMIPSKQKEVNNTVEIMLRYLRPITVLSTFYILGIDQIMAKKI